MPSGQTHEAINLTFFGGLAAGYAYAFSQGLTAEIDTILAPQTITLFSISYLVGTLLVTPDLDLAENNVRAKSNWGLLGWLWVPYGNMFNHRGLSHTWVIGPLTRLIYMAVIGVALAYLVNFLAPYFGYEIKMQARLASNWQELALGALAGYYLSQWLHLIADGVWPDHGRKRLQKRRKKRKARSKK